MTFKFNNLLELIKHFSDEKTCYEYLGEKLWGGTPACPHCGSVHVYVTKTRSKNPAKQGIPEYRCAEKGCCRNFSATVGTIFEGSKLPLSKWFAAIWLCATSSKGISSLNLSKQLGFTQKTSWFVLSRIREMFKDTNPTMLLSGTIEADETFVGGAEKNKHMSKRVNPPVKGKRTSKRKPIEKTVVLGLIEREGKM